MGQESKRADLILLAAIFACSFVLLALFAVDLRILLAVAGLAILPWAVQFTSRNHIWLLMPLALVEAVSGSKFLGDDNLASAFIRYPLVLLFCMPVLPALWRSGLLKRGGFFCYTIYFLWALLSVAHSPIMDMSLGRVISSFFPFCALCVIASECKDGDNARRGMGVLLLSCGLIVAANYFVLFVLPSEAYFIDLDPDAGIARFSGTFTQPNEIGALMLTTVGAAFCYWPLAKGRIKLLCAATVFGAVLLGVMADSRSPFIGLAIGGAAYLLWKYGIKSVIVIAALGAVLYLAIRILPNSDRYFTRGDVTTVTGRDVAWSFAVRSIEERPILGYGYEVEGEILQSRYFPDWEENWNQGPRSSLHEGYLSRAVGLGIPAMIFWIFLTLRPALNCFRRGRDPWSLKSLALLAVMPVMILNLSESITDCRSLSGLLLGLGWAMLESERLFANAASVDHARVAAESKSHLVRALQEVPV